MKAKPDTFQTRKLTRFIQVWLQPIVGLSLIVCSSTLLASQESAASDEIREGDILGVYIEGILGNRTLGVPNNAGQTDRVPTKFGFPLQVWHGGNVWLPRIGFVKAAGKTVEEFQNELQNAVAKLQDEQSPDINPKSTQVTMLKRTDNAELAHRRIVPGDVLGIFVEGILGEDNTQPPVHFPKDEALAPSLGYPFRVDSEGNIDFPWLDSKLPVAGLTMPELQKLFFKKFTEEKVIFRPEEFNVLMTLIKCADEGAGPPIDAYKIGPGDCLSIVTLFGFETPYLESQARLIERGIPQVAWGVPHVVDSNGELWLVGHSIKVEGMTEAEVKESISELLNTHQLTRFRGKCWVSVSVLLYANKFQIERAIGTGDVLCISGLVDAASRNKSRYFLPTDHSLPVAFGECFPVLENGTIVLPDGETLSVVGKQPHEISEQIFEKYRLNPKEREALWCVVRIVSD